MALASYTDDIARFDKPLYTICEGEGTLPVCVFLAKKTAIPVPVQVHSHDSTAAGEYKIENKIDCC